MESSHSSGQIPEMTPLLVARARRSRPQSLSYLYGRHIRTPAVTAMQDNGHEAGDDEHGCGTYPGSIYYRFILTSFRKQGGGSEKPSNLPKVTQPVHRQTLQTQLPLASIQCQGPPLAAGTPPVSVPEAEVPPPASLPGTAARSLLPSTPCSFPHRAHQPPPAGRPQLAAQCGPPAQLHPWS